MKEADLHSAWSKAGSGRATMGDGRGNSYRVLYSGMPGGSFGPDFRNAVVETAAGREVVGDVEIHVLPKHWYDHGHHRDPRYDSVMFHAVGTEPGEPRTYNSIGIEVPHLGIDASGVRQRRMASRGSGTNGMRGANVGWLAEAGDEWFAQRLKMFTLEQERYGPDLALQTAVFECLGYPRNRQQFRALAWRAPWPFLIRYRPLLAANHGDTAHEMLAWAAGFGARPKWAGVPGLPGDAPKWVMAAGRPANNPGSRVVTAASLVREWMVCGGPASQAVSAVRDAQHGKDVTAMYARAGKRLGEARAKEIVVNAILPFVAALAESRRDRGLYGHAHALYAAFPKLASNSALREATRILGDRNRLKPTIAGARDQQGLLHAYKTLLLRPRPARQIALNRFVPSV